MLRNFAAIVLACLVLNNIHAQGDAINAIIGNESWAMLEDESLMNDADEQHRIITHLNYVLSILKSTETCDKYKAQRNRGIKLLEEYVEAGHFPKLDKNFNSRRPCFIDSTGNICAVGYLLQETAGRADAERIKSLYQYDYLLDMTDEGLLQWQRESGFTLKELAMIQPAYDFRPLRFGNYYDQKEMLYGIIDNYSQEKITPPIFTSVQNVGEYELLLTSIDERFGVTNSQGEEVIKHVFEKIVPKEIGSDIYFLANAANTLSIFNSQFKLLAAISNGMLRQYNHSFVVIESNEKQGVLSLSGDWVIPLSNYQIRIETLLHHRLNDGSEPSLPNRCLFVVENSEHKYGVFNSRGKQIVRFDYTGLERKEFVWIATNGGDKSLLLLEGTPTGIRDFSSINGINTYPGSNGLVVCTGERCGLIAREGKWKIPQKFRYITKPLEFFHVYNDSGFACYDAAFNEFIPQYQKVMGRYKDVYYYYGNGVSAVKRIDGSYLIEPTKDSVAFAGFTPTNDVVFAKRKGRMWQLMNDKGMVYRLPGCESFKSFSREHVTLTYGGKTYLCTLYRDSVMIARDLAFSGINLLKQGIYAIKQNGKYGTIQIHNSYDKGYRRYYPSTLDTIYPINFQYNSVYMVAREGKIGILDLFGKVVLDFEYDDFREEYLNAPFKRGVYLMKEDNWYYFSRDGYALTGLNEEMQNLLETSSAKQEVDTHLKKLRTVVK